MQLQVAIQVHFFERRLCWMLSSIKHQIDLNGDHVSVSIAHVLGTGNPSTEDVVDFFIHKGMDISTVRYDNLDKFQYRGWTRNDQLDECQADWILFSDADMLFPPYFFMKAFELLRTDEYKDSSKCLYSSRFSTTLKETEDLLNQYEYPCLINNPYGEAEYLPGELKANVGAGYCHLVNVQKLKNSSEPYYCVPGKKVDNAWTRFPKAKSDQHFRRRVGKQKINLPVQIHLQHVRGSEDHCPLDTQR